MERNQVVTGLARIYDVCNRWDEKNKKKWTQNRALRYACEYGGNGRWGRINFNEKWARKQIWLNPGDDKTRETKCMFEPVKERGVFESIECRRQIESSKNGEFARVYVFEDVVCEFEQGSFSWVELAINRLKRTGTGRDRHMGEKSCKSKSLQNFANCIEIRNGPEIGRIRFWQTRFFQKGWDERKFEIGRKSCLGEW